MSREEYIASGVLESYLLDELSKREAMEVERLIDNDSEIREEFERIQSAFHQMAIESSKKPSLDLKSKILDEIESDGSKKVDSSKPFPYLSAASITLFLFSSIFAINFWNKWQSASNEVSALRNQNQSIAYDLKVVNDSLSTTVDDLVFVSQPNTQIVKIQGLDISPTSSALVYWNPGNQKVLFKVNSLPEPPEDKQYQLWAIIDGKPTDLGVFDVTRDFFAMNNAENPQAFAVTLEKKGGSAVPTLDQMYLLGEVS